MGTLNTHAPFLDLPLELRDIIYDELFQGVSLTSANTDIRSDLEVTFHFFYKFNGNRRHQSLPRWLFTCKQVLAEATEQWYRGASGSPCFCKSDKGRTMPGSYATSLCNVDRALSFDGPVLSTGHAAPGDYILWPSLQTRVTRNAQIMVPRISEQPNSFSVSDRFFTYLKHKFNHPARQIKFTLTTTPSDYLARGAISVDLSFFKSLGPRFERVVFRIACPIIDPERSGTVEGWPYLRDAMKMYLQTQHEAVRVSKYLVSGNNSTGWHLRDYLVPILNPSGRVVRSAYEWHVEVSRRRKQQSGELKYEGLRYCALPPPLGSRRQPEYFKPLHTETDGTIVEWVCDATGHVISTVD
jgi:hypothetical protein